MDALSGSQEPVYQAERLDERTGRPIDEPDYDEMVRGYLTSLQDPISLPKPPPLDKWQALAVMFNPQRSQGLMRKFREPYETSLAEQKMNLQREQEGARLAGGLAQRKEQRESRDYQKNWQNEMAAANSGNMDYPYTIPGMKDVAGRSAQGQTALTAARGRANRGATRPKFQTKDEEMAWLETQLRSRQSQLSRVYEREQRVAKGMPGYEEFMNVQGDIEGDYSYLRMRRQALGMMSQGQWDRFKGLPDEEQEQIIRQILNPPPSEEARTRPTP